MINITIKRAIFLYFLIVALLSLVFIAYDNMWRFELIYESLKRPKYTIIIINKSESPVYINGAPDLFSCGIYNNEKIYHVTLALHDKSDIFDRNRGHNPHFEIESKIDKHKTKKYREEGNVNNKNYKYNNPDFFFINENGVLVPEDNEEFCSDVHFVFYFTREPYTVNTYSEYIEVMKNNGYTVIGYFNKDKLLFTITDTELRINENAITDPLYFVHEIISYNKTRTVN
jgi:hypothetical protein